VGDTDVISAFWSSTTYWTLVHELNRDQPITTKEFLILPTSTPLVRRRSGSSLFYAMGKWSPAAAKWHRQKPPAKALRKVPRVAKGGKAVSPVGHSYYQLR
jgi:hypothetical protein